MTVPVEAAIETALMARATAFAAAQSLTIAVSNNPVNGTIPAPSQTARYLEAWVLPYPTITTAIPYNATNQYYGVLQINIYQGMGGGSVPMKRIVGAIAAYFPIGLTLNQDGFEISIKSTTAKKVVTEGPMIKSDPWMMIPVSVPYLCFAKPA